MHFRICSHEFGFGIQIFEFQKFRTVCGEYLLCIITTEFDHYERLERRRNRLESPENHLAVYALNNEWLQKELQRSSLQRNPLALLTYTSSYSLKSCSKQSKVLRLGVPVWSLFPFDLNRFQKISLIAIKMFEN